MSRPRSSIFNLLGGNIWQKLTRPASSIEDVTEYRRARLLSIFTLVMLVIFIGLEISYTISFEEFQVPPADRIGLFVLFLIFIISRSKYYSVGIIIVILMFPANTFSNILQGTTLNAANTINFLVISYVITSIFLSIQWTAIYSFLVVSMIWFLPSLAPETIPDQATIIAPFTINAMTAVLILVAMNYRDQVEETRQNELKLTYDNTLAGWSQALEFRDKETKGHSQRVTSLTVQLAMMVGITDQTELQHIRRGALLHDIGKMAIPNSILLKKEKLTDQDWEEIRKHPGYAYEMLVKIPFLQPALEIPYCHHEKWDGSGYPKGLQAEEIPLSARIFSVVDVWDALRSDRPYREAWSDDKAMRYIQKQSGKYFDPQVVDIFMQIVEGIRVPQMTPTSVSQLS